MVSVYTVSANSFSTLRCHVDFQCLRPPHYGDSLFCLSETLFSRSLKVLVNAMMAQRESGGTDPRIISVDICMFDFTTRRFKQWVGAYVGPQSKYIGSEKSNCLTTWSRVHLDRLIVSSLLKKYPAFYGNFFFYPALTEAHHLPLIFAKPVQSMPYYPTSQ